MLGSTPGVGLKSVTAAALLLAAAAFVRACLWPFTAWQTGTVEAPPAALALVAGVWPVMAGALLLRALPVLDATGGQAPRIVTYALAVAAGVALVALAVLRTYFAMAHGPLRRRRAFEPARVREAAPGATAAALGAGLLGLAAAALTFFTAWVGFLQSGRQAVLGMGTNVLWVA